MVIVGKKAVIFSGVMSRKAALKMQINGYRLPENSEEVLELLRGSDICCKEEGAFLFRGSAEDEVVRRPNLYVVSGKDCVAEVHRGSNGSVGRAVFLTPVVPESVKGGVLLVRKAKLWERLFNACGRVLGRRAA